MNFTQEQAVKAESRFRGIGTLSLTSALDGAGGLGHTQSAVPWERDPVPIVQEAGRQKNKIFGEILFMIIL